MADPLPPRKGQVAVKRAAKAPGARSYFDGSDEEKALGLLGVLSPEGTLDASALPGGALPGELDEALARRLYEGMLRIRIMDERILALQRQGRVGFYGEARGQEAAVVGSAAALEAADWLVPALREAGAGIYRGMSMRSYLAQIFGNANDPTKGRQMPCHPCDKANNYVVMSSCVSTQIPHAVGIAMGMRIKGDSGKCVIGYMGDGGTSEGDFHVSVNFAGVYKAPCILFCQNNQWAISTPGSAQSASATIAIKALGYGVEPLRVDGNDVLAVYAATKYAADKARRGDGPTFIEALTYRVSAHSSSDDPSRYRDETVTDTWRDKKDPLVRMRVWLGSKGWLDEKADKALAESIEADVRAAIAAEEAAEAPALGTLVDDVYEDVPWHLSAQLSAYRDQTAK